MPNTPFEFACDLGIAGCIGALIVMLMIGLLYGVQDAPGE